MHSVFRRLIGSSLACSRTIIDECLQEEVDVLQVALLPDNEGNVDDYRRAQRSMDRFEYLESVLWEVHSYEAAEAMVAETRDAQVKPLARTGRPSTYTSIRHDLKNELADMSTLLNRRTHERLTNAAESTNHEFGLSEVLDVRTMNCPFACRCPLCKWHLFPGI